MDSERPESVITGKVLCFLISIPWSSKLVWGVIFYEGVSSPNFASNDTFLSVFLSGIFININQVSNYNDSVLGYASNIL